MRLFFDDKPIGNPQVVGSYMLTRHEIVEMASRFDPSPGTFRPRNLGPGRVGDELRLRHSYTSKRRSASRPGQGIVTTENELIDQTGRVLVRSTGGAILVAAAEEIG